MLSPFLGLVLVEGLLRVFADRASVRTLLYMPGLRTRFDDCATLQELLDAGFYERRPFEAVGDFRLNSKALRTGEYALETAPGTRRIVILGDSHSFRSGGVPDALLWFRRMEDGLRARGVEQLEVINLAVPAVSPFFELRMWQLEGSRLAPDVVILALSLSNDLHEVRAKLAERSWVDRLARRCLTVRLVRNAARLSALDAPEEPASPADGAREGGFVLEGYAGVYDRTQPRLTPDEHDRVVYRTSSISDLTMTSEFEKSGRRMRAVLTELRKGTARRGAQLVVLLIPAEHQVHPDLLRRVVEAEGRDASEFDVERAQRMLAGICDELDIPCVDALRAIQRAGEREPMYRVRETHLNDLGHGVLADELVPFLLERELVR